MNRVTLVALYIIACTPSEDNSIETHYFIVQSFYLRKIKGGRFSYVHAFVHAPPLKTNAANTGIDRF